MELKLLTKTEKPFLGRKETMFKGTAEITPSKVQLKEEIAKILSTPVEMVVIKKVKQQFGKKDFEVSAYVYHDEKSLKEFEKEKKKKAEEAK